MKIPKFYGSIAIDHKNAILLENLNIYKGVFNINLNDDIDMIIHIVKNISEMHNRFYFKNEEEIYTYYEKYI